MDTNSVPSTIGATYVEPSAEKILEPGQKIGDLYQRNMTQPFVLQRLAERVWWVQSFNYGTVFYVGDEGVLIFDTLEGVYDNLTQAVASVTDRPIVATAAMPRSRLVTPSVPQFIDGVTSSRAHTSSSRSAMVSRT